MKLITLLLTLFVCLGISMTSAHAQIIVAHRGASADAPENTLSAFNLAWKYGSDAIEGDFYLTADGQIVCHHDRSTKRTAGVDQDISRTTLAKLKELEFGSWKGEKFRGEPIPTLDDVLQTVPDGKHILIEIKCGPEIVEPLAKVLNASQLDDQQLRIICFNANVIRECKKVLPNIKAYWLTGFDEDKATGQIKPTIDEILTQLKACQADGLDCHANAKIVDAEFVKQLRAGGYEFHCWTVNDPRDASHFAELGVDSITTDTPQAIRQAVNHRE